ncbi:uncharacterized protein LOC143422677 [Xylocopa sonorina]|uniref:uncharacterized protein LOC143422677 n=1 Tax=Xylocopa sonorina TaxID=1818115 RepID=UPI00403AE522
MNEKLEASTNSYEAGLLDSSRANSIPDLTANCCKSFLNCFKITRKKQLLEEMMDNDTKEYEHVVEKLVVKRIPFVLLSVPKNSSQCKDDSKRISNSTKNVPQSLTNLNSMHSASPETQSLLYHSDKLDQQLVPLDTINRYLDFNENRIISTKRSKKCIVSNDHCSKLTELMNSMGSLHTDLGKQEEPLKNSYSLNIPRNFGKIDSSETKSKIDPNELNQTNSEDCIQINKDLQCHQQVLTNESKALSKNIANVDLSNLILRWNIIVRHYKCKTLSFDIPQGMSKYFHIN